MHTAYSSIDWVTYSDQQGTWFSLSSIQRSLSYTIYYTMKKSSEHVTLNLSVRHTSGWSQETQICLNHLYDYMPKGLKDNLLRPVNTLFFKRATCCFT